MVEKEVTFFSPRSVKIKLLPLFFYYFYIIKLLYFFNIVWRLFDYYILRNIHTARERSGKLPLCPNCAACGIMCKLVCLQSFAQACLRTLCVAVRSVPEALWRQWSETLTESAAMETRECNALLEKLYDQMEREMQVNFSPDLEKKIVVFHVHFAYFLGSTSSSSSTALTSCS